jgi:hypothetical protein
MSPRRLKVRIRRSKPCSICRRWFTPNPRVGMRQRTCGRPECKSKQKQRTQAEWSRRNPSYWAERRLGQQLDQARQGDLGGVLRGPPAQMARTPVETAQEAIGIEAVVIVAFISRMLHRGAQDAIGAQLFDIKGQIQAINPMVAQEAIAPGGPDP